MRYLTTFALLVLVLCKPSTSFAGGLREALEVRVDQVVAYLKDKGEGQISIGAFTGPAELASSSGPGIAKAFHDLFTHRGIQVSSTANVSIRGRYALAESVNGAVSILLKVSLQGRAGDVITDFSVDGSAGGFESIVDRPEDVVQITGATTQLYSEDRDDDRNRDLKNSILKPSLHVRGARCSASVDSPFGLEILVQKAAQPILDEGGRGFVRLDRGQAYSVRLTNARGNEAAVALAIDGLSVFTFSEVRSNDGQPKYKVYIIAPHSSLELKGWHRTNAEVSTFQITRYSESAAASINHKQDIGTITATFFAAWPKGGKPPEDEDLTAKGEENATGFGAPLAQQTNEVQREIGRLRAAISVRYSK